MYYINWIGDRLRPPILSDKGCSLAHEAAVERLFFRVLLPYNAARGEVRMTAMTYSMTSPALLPLKLPYSSKYSWHTALGGQKEKSAYEKIFDNY